MRARCCTRALCSQMSVVARLLRCRSQHVTACDSFHLTPLGSRSSAPPRQAPIVRCSAAAWPASFTEDHRRAGQGGGLAVALRRLTPDEPQVTSRILFSSGTGSMSSTTVATQDGTLTDLAAVVSTTVQSLVQVHPATSNQLLIAIAHTSSPDPMNSARILFLPEPWIKSPSKFLLALIRYPRVMRPSAPRRPAETQSRSLRVGSDAISAKDLAPPTVLCA